MLAIETDPDTVVSGSEGTEPSDAYRKSISKQRLGTGIPDLLKLVHERSG